MGLSNEAAKLYRPEMQIPFPLEEYKSRMAKVKEEMARQRVDLLYCSAPESLFYLTGYENSWYEAQSCKEWPPLSGMAIKQDADKFILFDKAEEEVLVQTYSIATDVRIQRDDFPMSRFEFIIKNLKEEGWLKNTVGLEKWSYRPNPAVSQMFQAALEKEGCKVVDSTDIVREIRTTKSPQEMAYIRTAAKIADIGMKAAIEHIRPGMTELDVRAEMDYACAKAGGENPGLPTYVLAGQRSALAHGLASTHVIMPGDIVYLDLCGVYHRYHADLARTLSLGAPHPDVARQIDLSAKAFPILLKAIKPGCPINDANKAMEGYYKEVGIWGDSWWVGGYDIGIAFPPDWVGVFSYAPGHDAGDRTFPPGTVVNYESDFYLPQGAGLSPIMDTIAVTEDSVEILSKISQDLIVVEA